MKARRQGGPPNRAARAEAFVQVVIMLAIGGAAGAASFTHVHDLAAAHRQGGWLAWADAVVLELMSVAAGLEIRRRRRHHRGLGMPSTVLSCAVALSLSAQVVQAEHSIIGITAAAVPAIGFLTMVKIALGALGHPPTATAAAGRSTPDEHEPDRPHRTVPSAPPAPAPTDTAAPSTPDEPRPPSDTAVTEPHGNARPTTTDRTRNRAPGRPTNSRRDSALSVAPGRTPAGDGTADRVARLVPAARQAATTLATSGRPVNRDQLAKALRDLGYTVSNSHAGQLLKALEHDTQP